MSQDEKNHVSPEDLASSVTGMDGLDPRVRDHLKTCPVCRGQREALLEDLRALGRSARSFAPEPARTVVLPAPEPERRPFMWGLGLSVAAAAAAAVILVLSMGYPVDHRSGSPQVVAAGERADDQDLMAEVARLEENALPEGYQEISPEESTTGIDATLDFVVPIDDDDGLS
jgi:predicted anti-sigma-YlaC factor YlaD